MSNDSDDLDDLLDKSKNQSRTNTEPKAEKNQQSTQSLDEAVADALHRIDDGDLHRNTTIRDENLAALFEALDQTGQLENIQRKAEVALDQDGDDVTRAAAARKLVRVGLAEVSPEVLANAKSGREQYILEQESEF